MNFVQHSFYSSHDLCQIGKKSRILFVFCPSAMTLATTYVFLCFGDFSVSLFILLGLGSQLLDGWKHPVGGVGMTSDFEERNSVQDQR